ncbi:centrosomal protein of 44 kDa isoform X1 [Bombina bombina]|uniref:centrosomal protein of 44 kDa isoform X1 n=1 Tax=Bombina bombina TaxID=8345 RepID=UPI00235AF5EC|nr:centrosomal protein of 44 kDa isoform X1 [Bombina bombina]XP_053559813.1 centrosomal protein of 44 kDa isoform X1 [Bombina bombina]
MTTGDVKGVLRKLEQKLRLISYPRDVDYSGLVKGDPASLLPIISYAFNCYSTNVTEILVSMDIELTGKSDLRFIDAVYKILRDLFNYKPLLTKQQFLQCGFSERKIQIVCDIVDCVVKKHREFNNTSKIKSQPSKKVKSVQDKVEVFYPEDAPIQPLLKLANEIDNQIKPLVERHTGIDCPPKSFTDLSNPIYVDRDDVTLPDNETEVHCEPLVKHDNSSQIELLKIQLAECQEKLQRLDFIEEKLQTLENSMKGKIIVEEADWNNLISRVLLLETDREVQSKKRDLAAEFTNMSEECTSSRLANEISSDFRTKVVIPENHHQSSGYSSLLSTDTSPIAGVQYSDSAIDSKETAQQRMERIAKMMEETSKLLQFSNTSS